MFSRTLFALTLVGIPLAAAAGPDGHALFDEHCAACHGDNHAGGIGLPLTPQMLDGVDDRYLRVTIRKGRPGRVMPSFESLSDAQVEALVVYLRKNSEGRRPRWTAVRAPGDPGRGHRLFVQHCVQCHGADGSGADGTGVTLSRERAFAIMPPALNNPGFLAAASDQMIGYTIRNGRPETPMEPFSQQVLSDSDINDIVAHVRTFQEQPRPALEERVDGDEGPVLVFDSPYDFDTTVGNLVNAIKGNNFRSFPPRTLDQGLTDEFDMNRRQVTLRFCNFRRLYDLMNVDPRLGIVLPCRVTVVERDDGQVQVLAMNMAVIARIFNNDGLTKAFVTMQEVQASIIEEATF
jgi:cytochrome c oxidase cbb3-type subunit 3